MSNAAKRRLEAIGQQLAPTSGDTFEGIPVIKKVAPESNGARTKGQVVIITGKPGRIQSCSTAHLSLPTDSLKV